ncbi:hypothetical protein EGW08_020670, partial [Elysia chlorotica]
TSYNFYVLPHTRQGGDTMTPVSAGHIILTPTQPVRTAPAWIRTRDLLCQKPMFYPWTTTPPEYIGVLDSTRNKLEILDGKRNKLGILDGKRNKLRILNSKRNKGILDSKRNKLEILDGKRNKLGILDSKRNKLGKLNCKRDK